MGVYNKDMIQDIKKRSLHRSKILEGQMRGLTQMIDKEAYCMDILTQSLAIQKSLASMNKLIVENHISTHIQEMMTSGDNKLEQKAKSELSKLYELTVVRGKL